MRPFPVLALAALLCAPAAAQAPPRAEVISQGKRVDLAEHARGRRATVVLFMNDTSSMERTFLEELERSLPAQEALALRVVRLKNLEAPAAKQHEITATPTAIVLDRFGRSLARTGDPEQIRQAAGKGLRMGRIHWIDEEDPKAPQVYGAPPEALRRGVPGIVKTMSLRPDVMQMFMIMSRIHFSDGFLDRRTHELIAAYVSAINKCRF
jgi:alkylhydroperoxidase/carboxymuconolactone decarboxylase family protein YurZ